MVHEPMQRVRMDNGQCISEPFSHIQLGLATSDGQECIRPDLTWLNTDDKKSDKTSNRTFEIICEGY